MLPALTIVAAVGICTMTFNHSILSDALAVHSVTAACVKFRLKYILKECHICYLRQLKFNGLYYYGIVYQSQIMMEPNEVSN